MIHKRIKKLNLGFNRVVEVSTQYALRYGASLNISLRTKISPAWSVTFRSAVAHQPQFNWLVEYTPAGSNSKKADSTPKFQLNIGVRKI